jgi:hypothetical protein
MKLTKQTILQETQKLIETYLGFTCGVVSGKAWSRERLFARQQAYVKMVWLQSEANETIRKYSDDEKSYFALTGKVPKDLQSAYALQREAQDIWAANY